MAAEGRSPALRTRMARRRRVAGADRGVDPRDKTRTEPSRDWDLGAFGRRLGGAACHDAADPQSGVPGDRSVFVPTDQIFRRHNGSQPVGLAGPRAEHSHDLGHGLPSVPGGAGGRVDSASSHWDGVTGVPRSRAGAGARRRWIRLPATELVESSRWSSAGPARRGGGDQCPGQPPSDPVDLVRPPGAGPVVGCNPNLPVSGRREQKRSR